MSVTVKKAPGSRSPSYYIRQRLWRNKPAVAGLFVILIAVVISIGGYFFMPDSTPNANKGLVQLQKKQPGYTTTILKIRKAYEPEDRNFLEFLLFGERSDFTELPVESYQISGDSVVVQPVKSYNAFFDQKQTFSLQEIVSGDKKQADFEKTVEKQHLISVFEREHLEERTYWLGTDKAGRDVLSRLILGTRISLGIGFVAVLISFLIGMLVGSVAGYFGGAMDKAMQFIMTVVWSVPGIMLVIAISLALNSKGVWVSFVAVGLTMWVEVARVVRGQILSLKEKTYIEAARVAGIPQSRIIAMHLLPNMVGPLIVIATANFAAAILMEAGLSFLGLGVQPPAPSWGMMVNEGFQLIGSKSSLFLVVLPSVCISLLVLSFNLLGNGLRDAYDPKTPIANV